jgi:hypothetical protein
MQDINTLVTFSSRTGETEKLALAAALGAVQARAFIRLRWLRENVDEPTVNGDPQWRENRDRMAQEYIAPRPVDFEWADSLVIGMPARTDASCPELTAYLDALRDHQSAGKLHGKAIAALTTGPAGTGPGTPALAALYSGLAGLDLIVVPPDFTGDANAVDRARMQGRRVAEVARALKRAGV